MSRLPAPAPVQDAVWLSLLGGVGQVPAIGPERVVGSFAFDDDVVMIAMRSKEGSTRYVMHVEDVAASVLQVVSPDGRLAIIANAYTLPSFRRRGLAASLLLAARREFDEVRHSADLTPDGAAFAAATG